MSKSMTIDERWLRRGAWAIIAVVIVGGAVGLAGFLIKNGPEAPKSPPEEKRTVVEVEVAEVRAIELELRSQGEVVPVRRTILSAEVAGRLLEVHPSFEAGETYRAKAADPLLKIDSADYEAAFASAEANLADANLALKLEEARKVQALRDWKKLGTEEEPNELVRRIPQLASARARITASQSAVDKAQRDLDRTQIWPPYDCRIERTYVDKGAILSPGMRLADVVSLGAVEVRLPLSLEDYGYLKRDEKGRVIGQVVAIGTMGGEERKWTGRLIRSEEIVERTTRSIHVVAEFGGEGVEAPPIGMFVKATISAQSLEGVIEVKRSALVENEVAKRQVLIVDEEGLLQFRPVTLKRTEAETVLIESGVKGGDRIIVTPLNAPVAGLKVKILEEGEGEEESESEGEEEVKPAESGDG